MAKPSRLRSRDQHGRAQVPEHGISPPRPGPTLAPQRKSPYKKTAYTMQETFLARWRCIEFRAVGLQNSKEKNIYTAQETFCADVSGFLAPWGRGPAGDWRPGAGTTRGDLIESMMRVGSQETSDVRDWLAQMAVFIDPTSPARPYPTAFPRSHPWTTPSRQTFQ